MIEKQTLAFDDIEANETYKHCRFSHSTRMIRLSDVHFESCEFANQSFTDSEWLDCTFKNIHLANLDFSNSIFYRCCFEQCQLLGTNFSNNRWKNSQILDSRCSYLNFSGSTLEQTVIKESTLQEAFFQDVTVTKNLKFMQCELSRADFLDTKLTGIDFSESSFDRLIFSPHLIKGAVLSSYQATQFLALMGVKIN